MEQVNRLLNGYECAACGNIYTRRADVLDHVRLTHHDGFFWCTICNRSVYNVQSLQRHRKLIHPGEDPTGRELHGFATARLLEGVRLVSQPLQMQPHFQGAFVIPRDSGVQSQSPQTSAHAPFSLIPDHMLDQHFASHSGMLPASPSRATFDTPPNQQAPHLLPGTLPPISALFASLRHSNTPPLTQQTRTPPTQQHQLPVFLQPSQQDAARVQRHVQYVQCLQCSRGFESGERLMGHMAEHRRRDEEARVVGSSGHITR